MTTTIKPLLDSIPTRDPDEPEVDVWMESNCGRSSLTLTLRTPLRDCGLLDLGVWEGSPCNSFCIGLHVCRVGSANVRRYQGYSGGPILIAPGQPLKILPIP